MTQRHEEQKRERRRAEREKQATKLVPLMPILVKLGACDEAQAWLRKRNFATFQEAWDACPDARWLVWLVYVLCGTDGRDRVHVVWRATGRGYSRRFALRFRQEFAASELERALYDYAVREGLAR